MTDDPLEAVGAMIAEYGPMARPLREALEELAESPCTVDQLVQRTALPRRAIERLLDAVGGDLHRTSLGLSIRPDTAVNYRARFRLGELRRTRPVDPMMPHRRDSAGLHERLEGFVAAAPRAERSLDHVSAKPETLARRALWMDAAYDLTGMHLLCVGDHDLTSLAACAVNPKVAVTVVDLDERILAFIDEQATAAGWRVRCLYGDLRHGLPAPARDWADLAFTDPPYTPDGVRLFLARGLAGMRNREHGRLLLAYGFGEDHPALGLKVQRELQRLHLVLAGILPAFNRYSGAQAIGSAADLYVCRPTSRTWRDLETAARSGATGNLYTRGQWARESRTPALDVADADAATRLATTDSNAGSDAPQTGVTDPPVLAGDGWPAETAGAARMTLTKLLTQGAPPGPHPLAVDLSNAPAPWLLRTLLTTGASRVAVLVPNSHPDLANEAAQTRLSALLRGKYNLRWHRSAPSPQRAMVEAVPVPAHQLSPASAVARHVLERAHGKVANTWREGLIGLSREPGRGADGENDSEGAGRRLTKNEAREVIRDTSRRPETLDARLIDLPRHQIAELLTDISASAKAMRA